MARSSRRNSVPAGFRCARPYFAVTTDASKAILDCLASGPIGTAIGRGDSLSCRLDGAFAAK